MPLMRLCGSVTPHEAPSLKSCDTCQVQREILAQTGMHLMPAKPHGDRPGSGCRRKHAVIVAIATIAVAGCTSMAVRTAADYDAGSAAAAKLTKDAVACARQ